MPHLYAAVSGHGFGHLGQLAPVLARLGELLPELRLTLQTTLPEPLLRHRLGRDFGLVEEAADFGMLMADAVTVRVADSLAAYRQVHGDWQRRLQHQRALLERHRPDLVLANIPYLTLAAAQSQGLPSAALCSLNWADVLQAYSDDSPPIRQLLETMRAAYTSAAVFLRPEPSMPMSWLANGEPIGPVASLGTPRREAMRAALGVSSASRVVMVNLGGMPGELPIGRWSGGDVHWLVPSEWRLKAPRVYAWEASGLEFLDTLASCDALITKPGYGMIVEATCLGLPIAWVPRGIWPEVPYLMPWAEHRGRVTELASEALPPGGLLPVLEALWARPAPPPPEPSGVEAAARRLAGLLSAD